MHQDHLEKLISSGFKLITLETDSPEQSINDFRPLVREGKAIYLWEAGSGLRRMEASHIMIPKTQSSEMVLQHIKQNKHYGVYLLVGFGKELSNKLLQPMLKEIIEEDSNNKVIIFIDSQFEYPSKLMSNLLMTQEYDVRKRQILNQND